MTRAAVLVLALGCGTGAAPGAPGGLSDPQAAAGKRAVSPMSYLSDEFERVFPGRVRLARYGAVRLDIGDPETANTGHGEAESIDLGQSPALVVVDAEGERLRVVVEEGEYRLLLWIDAADLHWVVGETTDLAFEPGERPAAPPAPGVRVRPGLPVVRSDQRGPLAFVRHEDQCMSIAGWLPVDRLSRRYVPIDEPEVERDTSAAAGSALYERPSGRELARFTSECHVAYAGREEAGLKLVVYEGEGFEARGWIAGAASGGGGTGGLFGYGHGFGGLAGGERVLIPDGTCLYSGRGGAVVGVATDDAEEGGVQQAEGGWHSLSVATGWGDLTMWVVEETPSAPAQASVESEKESEEMLLLGPKKVKQMVLRRCR